ncbi:hypothetical protein [Methylobacterium sp. Leaf117]|uniref:hypothetical protein n=1 Tax=Methylobacterium sp. Leaf117 TaxID=1736260 RepID=UPI0012E1F1A4|nr:hypothetical protein [Methylobacterium sp. Leaf117]
MGSATETGGFVIITIPKAPQAMSNATLNETIVFIAISIGISASAIWYMAIEFFDTLFWRYQQSMKIEYSAHILGGKRE